MKTKISVHYAAVKSMSWNVFNGDQLATAGEDGLAYVSIFSFMKVVHLQNN